MPPKTPTSGKKGTIFFQNGLLLSFTLYLLLDHMCIVIAVTNSPNIAHAVEGAEPGR
jgi:hypothetical protein